MPPMWHSQAMGPANVQLWHFHGNFAHVNGNEHCLSKGLFQRLSKGLTATNLGGPNTQSYPSASSHCPDALIFLPALLCLLCQNPTAFCPLVAEPWPGGGHARSIRRAARCLMYSGLLAWGLVFAFPSWYLMSASPTLGWPLG